MAEITKHRSKGVYAPSYEERVTYMDAADSYAMHEYSAAAKQRSDLFTSITQRDGLHLLPGRYGGEYNNDMLAIGQKDGKTILMLGLKVTGADGGLQLDMMSLGPHRQMSKEWLSVVVYSLGSLFQTKEIADEISVAIQSRTLVTGVLYLDKDDGQVKAISISQETE